MVAVAGLGRLGSPRLRMGLDGGTDVGRAVRVTPWLGPFRLPPERQSFVTHVTGPKRYPGRRTLASEKFHKLLHCKAGFIENLPQGARSQFFVIGNDYPCIGVVSAKDNVASFLPLLDESNPVQDLLDCTAGDIRWKLHSCELVTNSTYSREASSGTGSPDRWQSSIYRSIAS